MKKFNVLIIAVIAVTAAFMTSCENDPIDFSAPTVTFTEGDQTVNANTAVSVSGIVYAEGELKHVIVKKKIVSSGTVTTLEELTKFDIDTIYNFKYDFTETDVTESFTVEVEVTDKNDKTVSKPATITVNIHDTSVDKTTSAIQLYPAPDTQTGNVPTFVSLTPDFTTYHWSSAPGNEATIDVMYYNGRYTKSASNAPHFVSANITTDYTYAQEALSGDNTTVFKILEGTELSNLGDWNSIDNDENIATIDMSSATTNVGEISDGSGAFDIGSIIAFKLSDGKMGLIKVNSLVDGNSDGDYYDANVDYITFDVIVQKEASLTK